MFKYLIAILLFFCSFYSTVGQGISYYTDEVELEDQNFCAYESAEYAAYWRDDFAGESLDTSKWLTWTPAWKTQKDNTYEARAVNKAATMFWRDENVIVEDGMCKLIAKKERSSWMDETREFTSGTIFGKSKISKTLYGKYEIRCKHPSEAGFKTSFWTFSQGYPLPVSEIDFIEYGDRTADGLMTSNIHDCYDDKVKCNELNVHESFPDISKQFVTCGAEWMPHKIFWYYLDDNGEQVILRTIYRYIDTDGNYVTDCNIPAGTYYEYKNYPVVEQQVIARLYTSKPKSSYSAWPIKDEVFQKRSATGEKSYPTFAIDYISIEKKDLTKKTTNPTTSSNKSSLVVNGEERISEDITLDNITVTKGSKLKIENCKVALRENGYIVLQSGAELVIDNVTLTRAETKGLWMGIIAESNSKVFIINESNVTYAQTAVLLNTKLALQNSTTDVTYLTIGSSSISKCEYAIIAQKGVSKSIISDSKFYENMEAGILYNRKNKLEISNTYFINNPVAVNNMDTNLEIRGRCYYR